MSKFLAGVQPADVAYSSDLWPIFSLPENDGYILERKRIIWREESFSYTYLKRVKTNGCEDKIESSSNNWEIQIELIVSGSRDFGRNDPSINIQPSAIDFKFGL